MSFINEVYNNVLSILPTNEFGRLQTKSLAILESIEDTIRSDLDPSISSLLEHPDILKKLEKENSYKTIKNGLKIPNIVTYLTKLKVYTEDVMSNIDKLETVVKNTISNKLNSKTVTFRQYNLFILIEDIKSNLDFSLRLIYLLIRDEKESVLPQKDVRKILVSISSYRAKVLDNTKIKSLLDEVMKLPNDVVFDRANLDAPDTIKDKDLSPKINNFIGNPIFTFRRWLVNDEIDTLNSNKELKAMLELRLMELRNEEAGVTDEVAKEKLQKQIAWHEDKLASLDVKIEKIESKAY